MRKALILLAVVALVILAAGAFNSGVVFNIDYVAGTASSVSLFWVSVVVAALVFVAGLGAAWFALSGAAGGRRKLEGELQSTYERLRQSERDAKEARAAASNAEAKAAAMVAAATVAQTPEETTVVEAPEEPTFAQAPEDATVVQAPEEATVVQAPDEATEAQTVAEAPDEVTVAQAPEKATVADGAEDQTVVDAPEEQTQVAAPGDEPAAEDQASAKGAADARP